MCSGTLSSYVALTHDLVIVTRYMTYRYTFLIPKMDCPCEEQLIRLKLQGLPIDTLFCNFEKHLAFIDAPDCLREELENRLISLQLGASLQEVKPITNEVFSHTSSPREERRILVYVLAINFTLFLIELLIAYLADSMGVLADSLDMLADALVYGLSLSVVSLGVVRQKQVARLSGYLQMFLALLGLFEVVRRYLESEASPNSLLMFGVSLVALGANILSLRLLNRLHSDGSHIAASRIFSANDVLVNLGVIVSAILVYIFDSPIPDWLVGGVTFVLVFKGAYKILALSK